MSFSEQSKKSFKPRMGYNPLENAQKYHGKKASTVKTVVFKEMMCHTPDCGKMDLSYNDHQRSPPYCHDCKIKLGIALPFMDADIETKTQSTAKSSADYITADTDRVVFHKRGPMPTVKDLKMFIGWLCVIGVSEDENPFKVTEAGMDECCNPAKPYIALDDGAEEKTYTFTESWVDGCLIKAEEDDSMENCLPITLYKNRDALKKYFKKTAK